MELTSKVRMVNKLTAIQGQIYLIICIRREFYLFLYFVFLPLPSR